MKVAIVGTGAQGCGLAALLAMEDDVEKLVLSDISQDALDVAKKNLGVLGDLIKCKDIEYRIVDAADTDAVCDVIRGCDIAFEAIYAEYNVPVMKACLREKCHYSDLFGSPAEGPGVSKDETIGAQLDMNDEFEKAGLLAVPSVGISPGWTSLAAQSVIDKLDEVNDVIIRFADCLDTDELIPPINAGILALEFFGPPSPMRVVHGKVEEVDLISSREVFEFPEPIGKRRIYTVTEHPDIVMIPTYCGKDVRVCEEKFGWFLGDLSVEDIWIKTLQKATSAQGTEVSNINIMEEMSKSFLLPTEYGRLVKEGKLREHYACYTVEVNGWKDGSFISHILYYNADLKTAQKYLPEWGSPPVYATVGGTPIELVLAMGRNQIKKRGVVLIDQLGEIDGMSTTDFFNKGLAKRGQVITEKIYRPAGMDV